MDLAEFIKKNVIVISALSVTILLTAVLAYLINDSLAKLNEYRDKVKEIQQKEKAFSLADYELTPRTLEIAKANAVKAEEQYQALLVSLHDRFDYPDYPERLPPIQVKVQITSKCDFWYTLLERRKVNTTVKQFTFENYFKETLPNPTDIPMIRKNLDIVEELINRLAAADIQGLQSIRRKKNNDLYPEKLDRFSYLRFTIDFNGNIVQVQRFVNSLTSSRYCFVVQKLVIEGADLTTTLKYPVPGAAPATTPGGNQMNMSPEMDMPPPGMAPPAPGGGALPRMTFGGRGGPRSAPGTTTPGAAAGGQTPPPAEKVVLSKDDRVVFTELANLKVKLVVDYVEFEQPPAESN